MEPFETEFDLQLERNQGVITQLVTGVAERLGAGDGADKHAQKFPG